jgi:tetratricopeptide (TPR) repeat protein
MENPGLLHELNGAVCPSCGRETPLTDVEDEPTVDQEPTETHPKLIVRDGDAESEEEWMVLKENGKVYGPFSMEVVVGWIEQRKINASEEVSPDGLEWWTFGEHEAFAHHFEARLSGIQVPESRGDLHFRRKTPFRDFVRMLVRMVLALSFVAAVCAGVWHSIHDDLLVVPEVWIERAVTEIKGVVAVEELPDEVAGPGPGDLLLLELAAAHPEAEGGSWEMLMRGRHLLLEDTGSSLRAARPLLEKAVVLNPDSGLALAALAELYNILPARELGERDLQRKSIYLLERAEASESWQAERLRARATFLIYSDHPEEVEAVALEAIGLNPRDPQLHFLLGMASKDADGELNGKARKHFEVALELDPGFHGVWYELGRSEEHTGNLWKALEYYNRKVQLAPASPATLVRLGAVYERLGQPDRAAEFYDQAIRFDPDEKRAVLRRAVLAYQRDGQPESAVQMFKAIQGRARVQFDIREKKALWCHLSAAQRLMGDARGAIATADLALAEDPGYAPALFHKALGLVASGRAVEALPLLNRADASGLDNWSRAQVLFAEGRAAQEADQLQDAVDAFDRAIDAYPTFMPGYFWRADVRLELGDAYLASKELTRLSGVDPLEYARERVAGLFYNPLPSLEPLVLRMLSAAGEQNFAPQLHAAAGLLLFHDGRFEQSERILNKALSQDGRSETAQFYKALSSYKRGRFSRSLEQFDALLKVRRGKAVFHVYRGDGLLELGRRDQAIESFKESFGLGVRSAWVHGRLSEAYAGNGQSEEALAEIQRGLQLDAASCALASSRFRTQL